MNAKVSEHNYICMIGSKAVVYNSITGARSLFQFQVDENIELYNSIKNKTVLHISDTTFSLLNDKGIVFRDGEDENALANHYRLRDLYSNALNLIILPTEQCNFRCVYCYEDYKNGQMEKDVINSLTKFLKLNLRSYSALNIDWFGGEPLCAYETIKETMTRCKMISHQTGIPVVSTMTTNGYFLNPEIVNVLLKFGVVGYQVTVDGTKEVHDAQRKLKNGGGTFDTILTNLVSIKNQVKSGLLRICIRINLNSKSIKQVDALFDVLKLYFEQDERFTLSLRYVRDLRGDGSTQNVITDDESMLEVYKKAQTKIPRLLCSHFLQLLDGPGCCYAGKPNSYVIGADGTIYKCTVHFKDEINRVGKLKNGKMDIDDVKISSWVGPQLCNSGKCETCWFNGRCYAGTCPYCKINSPQKAQCPFEKEYIEYILKTLYECGMISGRIKNGEQ